MRSSATWSSALLLALLWLLCGHPAAAAVVWSATDLGAGISGGGTTAVTTTTTADTSGRDTKSFSSGKIYYEFTATSTGNQFAGWANPSHSNSTILGVGGVGNSIGVRGTLGIRFEGTDEGVGTFAAGDRIALAFDIDDFRFWWKDITAGGAWEPSGDPNTLTGGYSASVDVNFNPTNFTGPYLPAYSFSTQSGNTCTAFFTPASFTGTIPTGFQAVDPGGTTRTLLGVGQ